MLIRPLLLATLFLSLAACCPCGTPTRIEPLPPAISLEEQSRRLTDWSHQLPRIKARTVLAGVRLDYRDDKGLDRTVNAEGLLQIRQHLESAANVPADVLLLGTSFDQPAFEAGRNAKDWWFAIKLDTKKAWMGDATHPMNFDTLGREGSASILRADLVPDLLGLSQLPSVPRAGATTPRQSPFLLMLVNDSEGANHLFLAREFSAGGFGGAEFTTAPAAIVREIIVDRYSGHVTEVRLYDPNGILAVQSQLSDYAPVSYAAGIDKPATGAPQFPRKVTVNYPSQHLTVSLQFDDVQVFGEFRPAVFTTPDFQSQGLRIIPAE